jgi:hypothetical protein
MGAALPPLHRYLVGTQLGCVVVVMPVGEGGVQGTQEGQEAILVGGVAVGVEKRRSGATVEAMVGTSWALRPAMYPG